jgi:hypothetical protein
MPLTLDEDPVARALAEGPGRLALKVLHEVPRFGFCTWWQYFQHDDLLSPWTCVVHALYSAPRPLQAVNFEPSRLEIASFLPEIKLEFWPGSGSYKKQRKKRDDDETWGKSRRAAGKPHPKLRARSGVVGGALAIEDGMVGDEEMHDDGASAASDPTQSDEARDDDDDPPGDEFLDRANEYLDRGILVEVPGAGGSDHDDEASLEDSDDEVKGAVETDGILTPKVVRMPCVLCACVNQSSCHLLCVCQCSLDPDSGNVG